VTTPPVSRTQRRKRNRLIAGGAVIVAAIVALIVFGLGRNLVYFYTPSELLAQGAGAVDRPLRLGGLVQAGSVSWDPARLDLRFVVTDGEATVLVRQTGVPPALFQEGMGVVVEGRYLADGAFHASNLMVKHSEEYAPLEPGADPHDASKTLLTGEER
jgi:cytochrome c-type biogenesis protein CcmE